MDDIRSFLGRIADALTQRRQVSPVTSVPGYSGTHHVGGLILIWFLVHLYDIFILNHTYHNVRAMMYFGLALIVFLVFYFGWDLRERRQVMAPFIVSFIAWVLPIVLSYVLSNRVRSIVVILVPVWFFYLLYGVPHERSRFDIVVTWFYIIVLIIYVMANFSTVIQIVGIQDIQTQRTDFMGAIKDSYAALRKNIHLTWLFFKGLPGMFMTSARESYAYAVGDAYTGKVDENANKKLGVYIEDLQRATPEFLIPEPISVWGTVIAQTLEIPINITKIECIANENTDTMKIGSVSPTNITDIESYVEEDIDCSFETGSTKENKLDEGAHMINLYASFNFETMAYIRTYFMDQAKARSLTREGIDILEHYQVPDTEPVAIYTAGPVMIGMDITPVNQLNTELETESFTFGLTLSNVWEGVIKEVKSINIILPPGVKLDNCGGYRIQTNPDGSYSVAAGSGIIEFFKTYRCKATIEKARYAEFLGTDPVSLKYIKVTSQYEFRLKRSISVIVKRPEGYVSPADIGGDVSGGMSGDVGWDVSGSVPAEYDPLAKLQFKQIGTQKKKIGEVVYLNLPSLLVTYKGDKSSSDLKYTAVYSNPQVASCNIDLQNSLTCKAEKEGVCLVELKVTDGEYEGVATFNIKVSRYANMARSEIDSIIRRATDEYKVDFDMVSRQIKQESNFDPLAISYVGAAGIIQIMPATAKDLGLKVPDHYLNRDLTLSCYSFSNKGNLNPTSASACNSCYILGKGMIYMKNCELNPDEDQRFDTEKNIFAGVKYLASLLRQFKDNELALAAYNCGPGRAKEALKNCTTGTTFSQCRSFFPAETQKYVTAILG